MTNRTMRIIPEDLAPRDPKGPQTIVLSPKAQLYLEYAGLDLQFINRMASARDMYLRARTTENINRITTLELENIVKNGLTLATRRTMP